LILDARLKAMNRSTALPELMVINYLDSSLRVKTLSFEEAAGFIPQGGT